MIDTNIAAEDHALSRAYWILFTLVSVLICLPVWFIDYAPLVDYPAHLARAYITYRYEDVGAFRLMYDRVAEPIPNLAIDVVVPFLLRFVGIEAASKIFLTLTLLLFNIGCHLLGRAVHGRPTWLALSCALFSYNSMFLYGFVNYMFGVGLFLIAFSVWLNNRKHWSVSSLILVHLLVFASYLAHLSSYAFLGMAFAVCSIFDYFAARRTTKNLIFDLLPLVPPIIAFKAFITGSGSLGEVGWNTAYGKLVNVLTFFIGYDLTIGGILIFLVGILITAVAVFARNVRVERPLLIAGCVFGIFFLASPKSILTGTCADARFVLPFVVVTLISLRFEVSRAAGKYALFLFLVITSARLGDVWNEWGRLDGEIAAEVKMFDHFTAEAKVYPIVAVPGDLSGSRLVRPFTYVINYSSITRHTFSPTLWAIKGQQPLAFKHAEYSFIDGASSPTKPNDVNWQSVFSRYDYIWCYNVDDSFVRYLAERCDVVAASSNSMIFRTRKV